MIRGRYLPPFGIAQKVQCFDWIVYSLFAVDVALSDRSYFSLLALTIHLGFIMTPSFPWRFSALLAVFPIAAFAEDPPIVDITWAGSQNGDITNINSWTSAAEDWEASFPDFIGRASVGSGSGPYTVTLTADFTAQILQNSVTKSGANLPVVTFLMDGNTMNLTATGTVNNASVYLYSFNATSASDKGFVFDNGFVNAHNVALRGSSGGDGPTLVLQNGTHWTNAGSVTFPTTVYTGLVEVMSGSTFTATGSGVVVNLGSSTGSTTTLRVSGEDSAFNARTPEETPNANRRTVTVGGQFTAHNYLYVADQAEFTADQVNVGGSTGNLDRNPAGSVFVDGAGTTFEAKWVNVGGARANVTDVVAGRGDAFFTVSDGASAEIEFLQSLYKPAGTVGDVEYDATFGRVILDNGSLTLTGDSILQANTLLHIHLYANNQAAALTSTSTFTITNAILGLEIEDSFSATLGDKIALIDYTTLTGQFAGYDEGDEFSIGGYSFQFTYNLDGQNVVGLTVIPEPRAYALLFAAVVLGVVFIRRRKQSAGSA